MSIEVKDPSGTEGGSYDNELVRKIYLAEPPSQHTIYRDLRYLPNPTKLGITIKYFNYDDETLYFQIIGEGTDYTFGTVNLGALASGSNAYKNLDEFASRPRPEKETSELIRLTLKAYRDAGYTDLKWTYQRDVQVIFIDSLDGSWTTDVLNNFDDGTVQGWNIKKISGHDLVLDRAVVNDYMLSFPNSLKGRGWFSTSWKTDTIWIKYVEVTRNSTVLTHLGKTLDTVTENYVPLNKWMRIVVPLPKNTTLELRLVWAILYTAVGYNWQSVVCLYKTFTTPDKDKVYAVINIRLGKYEDQPRANYYTYMWQDDFKIISK